MRVMTGRLIAVVIFFLLVFGLSATGKVAWATDPAITSPVPGAELTTPTIIFEWEAGTEDDFYRLHIGTEGPGSTNISERDDFGATSYTATIPLDGNAIYVRLWWSIGHEWNHVDYTYQTVDGGGSGY